MKTRLPRRIRVLLLLVGATALTAGVWWGVANRRPDVTQAVAVPRLPKLSPDYAGIVLPPNIAPLNFVIREPGQRFFVRLQADAPEAIEVVSRSPSITLPPRRWQTLLTALRGQELRVEVYVEAAGQWQQYQTIVNRVAPEDIDGYLVYRQVGTIHNFWRQTAILQRDLGGYQVSSVLDGNSFERGCVNCHTFSANDTQRMLLGMRSAKYGRATLFADGDSAVKFGQPFGYTAWHPNGRLAAYSINKVRQFFHSAGLEVRDVIDLEGSLGYCRVEERKSGKIPRGKDEPRMATYPTWTPDGRYLYYCSAPILWEDRDFWPPKRWAEVKYDLMRMAYDPAADRWGEPETVLAAEKTGLSILLPRISPDGKYLVFCMCRYGCFPVLQPTSDLYLLDLATGKYRRLDINSEFSESYHSWSSNSRWLAFSSRRQGGVFTRVFFSYVDETGRAYKPFVMPQQDPAFYDSFLKSNCVPELVKRPVQVQEATLARTARSLDAVKLESAPADRTKTENLEPYQQSGR